MKSPEKARISAASRKTVPLTRRTEVRGRRAANADSVWGEKERKGEDRMDLGGYSGRAETLVFSEMPE